MLINIIYFRTVYQLHMLFDLSLVRMTFLTEGENEGNAICGFRIQKK